MPQRQEGTLLWVERFASRSGFESLATWAGHDGAGPYFFIIGLLILDVPVLSTIGYLRGNIHPLLEFPVQWVAVFGLLLIGVRVARGLKATYLDALQDLRPAARTSISRPFSNTVQYSFLLVGYGVYYLWLSTAYQQLLAFEGPIIGGIKWFVIVPFVYLIVVIDYTVTFAHTQLYLPYLLSKHDVELDFSDARRIGGLRKVGITMKRGTESYYAALIAYTILLFHPYLLPDPSSFFPPPGRVTTLVFVGLWVGGLVFVLSGIFLSHRHMVRKREQTIERILDQIRHLGQDHKTYFYTDLTEDSERIEYLQHALHLDRVERTQTYPFKIGVAWELFGVIVFPAILQIGALGASRFIAS